MPHFIHRKNGKIAKRSESFIPGMFGRTCLSGPGISLREDFSPLNQFLFSFLFFLKMESYSVVAQAGVQWTDNSSL